MKYFFEVSVGIWAFITGLRHISSFFSFSDVDVCVCVYKLIYKLSSTSSIAQWYSARQPYCRMWVRIPFQSMFVRFFSGVSLLFVCLFPVQSN